MCADIGLTFQWAAIRVLMRSIGYVAVVAVAPAKAPARKSLFQFMNGSEWSRDEVDVIAPRYLRCVRINESVKEGRKERNMRTDLVFYNLLHMLHEGPAG